MKKRVLAFILTVNLIFLSLIGRLYSICLSSEQTASQQGIRVKDISTSRGNIYDRNTVSFTNTDYSYTVCIKPTELSLNYLRNKGEAQELSAQLTAGSFTTLLTQSPEAYEDCEDIKVLPVYKRYTDNSLVHIIGYTDSTGNGVCGIEKYFNDELKAMGGTLSVAYSSDANGRMLTAEPAEIRDNGYYTKSGIILTIDRNLQCILEAAMTNAHIEKGAGVILDTKTNEILACASFPVYNRNELSIAIDSADAPFINRAFSAFPVGSVFKPVTAAAALENGDTPENYFCNGYITLNGNTFLCSNTDGHGEIDFDSAMAKSCNPYFISLGVTTGDKSILSVSEKLGLGKSTHFGNGFATDSGVLPANDELISKADVGNLSFGQGKLSATPLQIAAVFSCIGNGGYYIEPSLIKGTVDNNGVITSVNKNTIPEKVLSDSTCNRLCDALEKTISDGTGTPAQSKFYTACTKTATAQSGQYDKYGNEIKYCWFVGFFPKENPQYTICIMKEQGSSGGSDCGPVFKEIAENILFNF